MTPVERLFNTLSILIIGIQGVTISEFAAKINANGKFGYYTQKYLGDLLLAVYKDDSDFLTSHKTDWYIFLTCAITLVDGDTFEAILEKLRSAYDVTLEEVNLFMASITLIIDGE